MSMGIVPMGVVAFAPVKDQNERKNPFVLDESLPRTKDPNQIMNERMKERIIEAAKNKPEEERTFLDYLVLAQDKLENMKPPVCYMA